ncbi:MAG: Asp-tRNA(Asn)/Glu-tRNA(Gln) amidotransferase subunit GatA [Phototrophicaceae bacterium]|jgi:aspartyl-tRNA(Asn)/glutamyl-tRNA(Gln) amidotransferase subunit A
MTDFTALSLSEQLAALNDGLITSVALTQAYLDNIQRLNPTLNSYITVTQEDALIQAAAADNDRIHGRIAPLLGLPLGIKDVLSTKGIETTCASNILRGYVPVFDATAVARLKAAGALILGKLNMDEFAMGSSNENSAFGLCRNPWDIDRVPGGSSGGSGVAVAAGLCAGALGTDTGGSVRLPASYCGITAMKPSYGRVSRWGLIAYGSSLDSIGTMGRTVEDTARLLQVIAGHDPKDSTSMPLDVPNYLEALEGGVKGLKIGVPEEYFGEGIAAETAHAVRTAIAALEQQGATVHPVKMPMTEYCLPAYYLIATSEASSNLARYDGIRFGNLQDQGEMWDTYRVTRGEGFGDEVKLRIMLGTYALSAGYYDAYYGKAQAVRTLIKRDFDNAFEQVDVLITPVAPDVAFKIGENISDPLQMYLADVLSVSANLAGVAALALPCGFSSSGLPIGMQIFSKAFNESAAFRVGAAYQAITDWHTQRPTVLL